MAKTSKKAARKGRSARRGTGDIPARPKHTYSTISCPLPNITQETVVCGTQTTYVSSSNSALVTGALNFQLTNFAVGSGFFDQYKMEAVSVSITPQQNAINLQTSSSTNLVPFYTVIDYDDSNTLSTVALIEAYANCIVLGSGESCERTFAPHLALAAYSGTFASYANSAPMWIDSASNTVQHYGIKYVIPQAAVAQTLLPSWQITVRAYIRLRQAI